MPSPPLHSHPHCITCVISRSFLVVWESGCCFHGPLGILKFGAEDKTSRIAIFKHEWKVVRITKEALYLCISVNSHTFNLSCFCFVVFVSRRLWMGILFCIPCSAMSVPPVWFSSVSVPEGSPSRGGDVVVYVKGNTPTELVYSLLFRPYVFFCLYGPFNCISYHKFSWQLSAFSLCSSSLNSVLLVLSAVYLFMKVSLSPDIILCGWLGLKHQLTN